MRFHVAGNHVIVEGFENGVMADGTRWPVERRSEGRFANVFEFEGDLIKRVYVYVDPDFASTHTERFLWGDNLREAKSLKFRFEVSRFNHRTTSNDGS